jgi:hypothetical protein
MNIGRQQSRGDKVLFLFSLLAFVYFVVLIVTSRLKWDPVFLGVVRELVTLPAVLGVLVLLVLSGMAFIKGNFKMGSFAFYALVVVVLTLTAMVAFA